MNDEWKKLSDTPSRVFLNFHIYILLKKHLKSLTLKKLTNQKNATLPKNAEKIEMLRSRRRTRRLRPTEIFFDSFFSSNIPKVWDRENYAI